VARRKGELEFVLNTPADAINEDEVNRDALVEAVASHALACLPATLERLCSYLTIPAISCEPEHHADVARLCVRVAEDLTALGFSAKIRQVDGALPLVAAQYVVDPALPTVLIYGHLDLQPVRGEAWTTPPHQGVVRGGRLYARGAADDMGGWVSHLAALEAWLSIGPGLPLNVKLVIEGEEEIGSPNLERYMDAFAEDFAADVMVLTDCENPSEDVPGLTVSLRGLLEVDITCEALTADVHSGLWGNMVPDSGNALLLVLARLLDADGRLDVARMSVPSDQIQAMWQVPLNHQVVTDGGRLKPEVAPLPLHDHPPAEWLWRQPAMTILSTTLPALGNEKNAIRKAASARLSLRVAPGQTAEELFAAVQERLAGTSPGGVRVIVTKRAGSGQSWLYTPAGPAFAAADRAYLRAWGRPLLPVGIGGSIPFVALFGRRYSSLPLILNGVLDPKSGAHGPDESLHLGIFEKAILANVYLLDELARVEFPPPAVAIDGDA
jgi:cysteinylglycine-S-conjugate dipeptidase